MSIPDPLNLVTGRLIVGTGPVGGYPSGITAEPVDEQWQTAWELDKQAHGNPLIRNIWGWSDELLDSFTATDEQDTQWRTRWELVEQVSVSDLAESAWQTAWRSVERIQDIMRSEWQTAFELQDTFTWNDFWADQWRTRWTIRDTWSRADLDDPLTPPDYLVTVLNGQSGAPAEWSGISINGFLTIGRELYAITSEGVYKFTGADDDGANITARVRGGMTDMGSDRQKRIDSVRIAGRAAQGFDVKLREAGTGDLREFQYETLPETSNAPREHVAKPGKGLRWAYAQVEISNKDGAEMKVDRIDIYPEALNRRR